MIIDPNATIKHKNSSLNSVLAYDQGYITLDSDGYILENSASFNRHWEILDDSFTDYGNKQEFDLTGFHYEITNFELEFKYKPFVLELGVIKEMEYLVSVKYAGFKQELTLCSLDESINIKAEWGIEDPFRQLHEILIKSNQHVISCFGCALSAYEKGGATLYCMKNSKDLFLSKPYLEQYHNHLDGLEREMAAELYSCDQFEINHATK